MKKQFFTLILMLALVVVAGGAWAQTNARYTPATGSTWTYTVNNLEGNTAAVLTVNQNTKSTTEKLNAAGTANDVTGYSYTAASSFTDTGDAGTNPDQVTATINWTSAGTYNLWLEVTGTSCTNRVYKQVVVFMNVFDASIVTIGPASQDELILANWNDEVTTPEVTDPVCPVFSADYKFDIDGTAPNAYTPGKTYAFFRVEKLDDNGGSWNITISTDNGTISYYNGTAWQTESDASINYSSIANGTTYVLVRVELPNIPAGYADVNVTLAATESNAGGGDPLADSDSASGANTADIEISAMPNLSGVTFE